MTEWSGPDGGIRNIAGPRARWSRSVPMDAETAESREMPDSRGMNVHRPRPAAPPDKRAA